MRRGLAFGIVLAALGAGACDGCAGCAGCGGSDVLATLELAQGLVEADVADAPVHFEPAGRGRRFRLGDAVRTAVDARADLTLAGGGTLHVEPRSLVRFSATPGASQQVGIGVEIGGAEVEAPTESELTFSTVFGSARVGQGSRVRLSGGADARFEVMVGSALIDGDGGTIRLAAGDHFLVEMGGAVLERRPHAQPRDGGRPAPSAGKEDGGGAGGAGGDAAATDGADAASALDAGAPTSIGDAPDATNIAATASDGDPPSGATDTAIADLSIRAGDSASIHDPDAPTAVRFVIGGACATGGTVEVARRGSSFRRALHQGFAASRRGRSTATLTVPIGRHAYRVRCGAGAPFATGALRVSRDAGTATLPTRAPRTAIDADGRRYTVLYQTLLPIITLRWRRARAAPGYVISVQRNGGRAEDTITTRPEHTFPAGRFGEGTYTFTFRTRDGRTRTAPTSLVIDFDNASPAAHLETPAPRAAITGGAAIAGAAGEHAVVSVGGHTLAMDRHGRFSGSASPAPGERCIAIRVADPQRGVHYFLRCGGH